MRDQALPRHEPVACADTNVASLLDRRLRSTLTGTDGSPTREVEGINREHGADDPKGTKTVAAPATVSGSSFILVVPRHQPLRDAREGR